jgi:hypothetical protein
MSDFTTSNLFNNISTVSDIVGGKSNIHPPQHVNDQINVINTINGRRKVRIHDDHNANNINTDSNKKVSMQQSERYDPYKGYLDNLGLGRNNNTIKQEIVNVDIDSAHRRLEPSIITESSEQLQNNPIKFTNDSNVIFIKHTDHELQEGDLFTIENVVNRIIILKTVVNSVNAIQFTDKSQYIAIKYQHNIPSSYAGTDIKVEIKGLVSGSINTSYINNIQINYINNIHVMYITKPKEDNVGAIDYDIGTFYIKLPKNFSGSFTPKLYNFCVKIYAIAGISTRYLNARFPLDDNHNQGYFSVNSIQSDGYFVNINKNAIVDESISSTKNSDDEYYAYLGGANILVSKISNIIPGNPKPNKYKISLGKTYNNVVSIKLISSIFPNSKQTIHNNSESTRNNRIYWQNLDDGDHMYNIEVEPGNYSPSDLITEMQTKFYDVQRIQLTGNTNYNSSFTRNHYIRLTINTNTNIVEFKSYKEAILINPITGVIPDIDENSGNDTFTGEEIFEIIIYHKNHGLQVGDSILVQKSISHLGIPATSINTDQTISSVIDDNNYGFKLKKFNLSQFGRTITKGGVAVFVYIPNIIRLRFDQTDTFGNLLGFRNVGHFNAITKYGGVITNKDPYEIDILDQQVTNNFVNLSGDDYLIMSIKQFDTLVTNGPISDAFAKILLIDTPGKVLYNTFVSTPKIFREPVSNIDEIDVRLFSPDGSPFEFYGLNHSFTLEIVSLIETPDGTDISAKSGKLLRN